MAIGLSGLIVLLWPLWFGQMLISRFRTARRTPTTAEIPRVDLADSDLRTIMAHRTPVIIRGLTDSLDLELLPDLDGLRAVAADGPAPFRVKTHKDHSPYFLYRGDYGAELDHTSEMELDEFVRFMFDAEQAPGTCTYRLFSVADLDGRVGDIVDDISDRLATRADATPDRQASGLWISSRGVVTPLHHDAWTGLLFQFHGAKRVRMFSPVDRTNLYFSSPASRTPCGVACRAAPPTPMWPSSHASPVRHRTKRPSKPARCCSSRRTGPTRSRRSKRTSACRSGSRRPFASTSTPGSSSRRWRSSTASSCSRATPQR